MPPARYSRLDCDLDASEEAELWRLEAGEPPEGVGGSPPAGGPSGVRGAGGAQPDALPVPRRTLKGHTRERGVGARAGGYERESNTGGLACKEGKWSVRETALAWSAFTDVLAGCWEGDTEAERLESFFRGEAAETTAERRVQARARGEVWRATKLRADQEAEEGGMTARKKSSLINKVTSLYHKQSAQPWSKDEVSTLRRMADADVPWHEIGQEMGRSGQACKQAYAHYAKSARLGRFTMEEERRLTRLVEAAAAAQAAAPRPPAAAGELYRNLPWSAISDLFPGRTANHLRAAWQRLAPHRMARVAVGPREDLQLLESIASSGVEDESDVTWERLHPKLDGRLARQRLSSLSKQLGSAASSAPLHVRVRMLTALLQNHLTEPGEEAVARAAVEGVNRGGEAAAAGREKRRTAAAPPAAALSLKASSATLLASAAARANARIAAATAGLPPSSSARLAQPAAGSKRRAGDGEIDRERRERKRRRKRERREARAVAAGLALGTTARARGSSISRL